MMINMQWKKKKISVVERRMHLGVKGLDKIKNF